MMKSCLYEGTVSHRRTKPVENQFRYSLFMVYLDLDELEEVFRNRWFWSTEKMSPAWFRREDHMGDPGTPLDESVRDFVEQDTGERPGGPIRLLTHLRYFGYLANPVSFYYCFDESGQTVKTIVAEVNNTPWGERHCYVLSFENQKDRKGMKLSNEKEFHVSPFMDMNQMYQWSLTPPEENLAVSISNYQDGEKLLDASMTLKKKPVNGWELSRVLILYPLMTFKVTAAIYWQALKLWWKKCPFYPHPGYTRKTKRLMS